MPADFRSRTAPPQSDAPRILGRRRGQTDLDLAVVLDSMVRTFAIRSAAIHLVDGAGLRVEAAAGPSLPPSDRGNAFCRHTIDSSAPFIVPDASRDGRFAQALSKAAEPPILFYAGWPLVLDPGQIVGTLCIHDGRPRRFPIADRKRLAAFALEVTTRLARQRDRATIESLRTALDAQAALIREQASALAHSRKIFDRASAAARIGVWECNLADETLRWTDTVYDIFDLERGSALDRQQTLACYSAESRKTLETIRSRAIAERGGFQLDAQITTAKGRHRWIRLTATVECDDGEPTRIFGMKQDITEEKILSDRTRYLAEFDVMTGLANRAVFQARLAEIGEGRADGSQIGAILLIDLDGFKQVNDTFGHAMGDEVLKAAALQLRGVCRDAELVARIGGDEFAVLLGFEPDGPAIADLAERIVEAIGRSVQHFGRPLKVSASVGAASIATGSPSDLFIQADAALYAAKSAGRNTYRVFDPIGMPAMDAQAIGHAPLMKAG